jgi:hypothetical protein
MVKVKTQYKRPARHGKEGFKDRVTNPKFLLAVAGFVYMGINFFAKQQGFKPVDLGTFQLVVDLVAYALTGAGIYSVFRK